MLLAAYDDEAAGRRTGPLPAGRRPSATARCTATTGSSGGGFVLYRDLAGLDGRELDALIERQVEVVRGTRRGVRVEAARPRPAARPRRAAGGAPVSSRRRPRRC